MVDRDYMRRLNDGIGRRLRDRSVRSHSSTRSIRAIWKRPGKHILYGPQSFVAQAKNEYRVERPTLLGAMISPARRPLVFEAWSPCEIATFEGALALHGKNFHMLQRFVKTKSTKEIIEFYYVWKMTTHGREWKKKKFVPDIPDPE